MTSPGPRGALIVVDVQAGFDEPLWGPRDNPGCESNIDALIACWRADGSLVVIVRHDSLEADSPLRPERDGNRFKWPVTNDVVQGADLVVSKHVHSAFHGDVDLHAWLRERGVAQIAVVGITTNHCCETTARVAADLGYDVLFVRDATHTFDRVDVEGQVIPAAEIARVSAANLHGEFATVITTGDLLASRGAWSG